ncbi:MAG: NlpC/P60 family protein [Pseudomonadota bacterium]|nr:NlpC/P60 family protein [Pseudomonadota bacterium]
MIDVNEYIGLPYQVEGRGPKAYDCWGLIRLVYADRLGIDLPSNLGYDETLTAHTSEMIEQGRDGWLSVAAPSAYDVVLLNVAGSPNHIGLVIAPGWMLHTTHQKNACIESYTRPAWRQRVEGFYHCWERSRSPLHSQ